MEGTKQRGPLHPYLKVWLGCRKYSTPLARCLPAAGGWLDQNAELLLAFDVCEECFVEATRQKEVRAKAEAEVQARVEAARKPPKRR